MGLENNILFEIPIRQQVNMIKVIGVGGGGGSAVNFMFDQQIQGVDFVVCNTDLQDLHNSPVPNKLHLGNDPLGTGAGANPVKGAQAANESIEGINQMFDENTRMVFITAGMGGGTGTGAAPVIAKAAKDHGVLVIGMVTFPFKHEGRHKIDRAKDGIEELRKHVDSLIVINNNKLRDVYGNLGRTDGYAKADEVLLTGIKGMAEVITKHYKQNIDLQDAKTVLENSGTAIMGTAMEQGEDRAKKAIINALDSPLLNDNKITGARNVLLLIVSGKNEITIDEIGEINDFIQAEAGYDVEIISGYGRDDSEDGVSVTIVATGFEVDQQHTITNTEPKKVFHTLEDDQPAIYNFENKTIVTDRPKVPRPVFTEEKKVFSLEEDSQEDFFSVHKKSVRKDVEKEKKVVEQRKQESVYKPPVINDIDVEYEEITLDLGDFVIHEVTKQRPVESVDNQPNLFNQPIQPDEKEELTSNEVNRRHLFEDEYFAEQQKAVSGKKTSKSFQKPIDDNEEEFDADLNFELKVKDVISEQTDDTSLVESSPLYSSIEDAQKRRLSERSNKLRQYNHNFSNDIHNFEDLENVPAYKRQGVNDSDMGRRISDKKVPMKKNDDINLSGNKFLFDNAD